MSDAHSQPMASGDLARTPFAHLVLYLYQRRSSGTLVVRADAEYRTLFHRGRAVAARVPQPSAALDDALISLTGASSGAFEFHQADLVGSGPSVVTGMFDPYTFALRAAREHAREETIERVLSKYGSVPLTLEPATDWRRLSLNHDEQQLVAALRRAPLGIEALCAQLDLPRERARRLLYGLVILRAVVPEVAAPESSADTRLSATVPPVRPSPAPRPSRPSSRGSGDAWRAIASAAGAMAEGRPPSDPSFRPPRSASGTRPSQAAPRAISRPLSQPLTPSQASPRAVSRPLSQPLTAAAGFDAPSRPLSRPLSEPLSTRSGDSRPLPTGRDSLAGLPRARPSTPLPRSTPRPSLPDVETLDADGKFRRVELLCQRNAYNEALPIIRGLLESDRKNPKYLGMLSHVLLGRVPDTNFGKELVDAVNQALRIDSDEVHALYTKARCYKRLGKEREALHYFRRTVAVDPNHLDAAREARLLLSRLTEKRKR